MSRNSLCSIIAVFAKRAAKAIQTAIDEEGCGAVFAAAREEFYGND